MEPEKSKNPLHVFIIPDVNAAGKRKGLPVWAGHQRGYIAFQSITRRAWSLGITHLTVWALSRDNI